MTQTSIPHASVHFNAISSLFYSISELTLPKKFLNFIGNKSIVGFLPSSNPLDFMFTPTILYF